MAKGSGRIRAGSSSTPKGASASNPVGYGGLDQSQVTGSREEVEAYIKANLDRQAALEEMEWNMATDVKVGDVTMTINYSDPDDMGYVETSYWLRDKYGHSFESEGGSYSGNNYKDMLNEGIENLYQFLRDWPQRKK